jgi:hypothetical protein
MKWVSFENPNYKSSKVYGCFEILAPRVVISLFQEVSLNKTKELELEVLDDILVGGQEL